MTLWGWFVVIFVTSGMFMLGAGWVLGRGQAELERVTLLAELDQATTNVQLPKLPRAGYLTGPPFAGAQDPGYRVPPPPVPWDLAGAAYALGQQRASQDEVSREVDAMIAEYEARREG